MDASYVPNLGMWVPETMTCLGALSMRSNERWSLNYMVTLPMVWCVMTNRWPVWKKLVLGRMVRSVLSAPLSGQDVLVKAQVAIPLP